MGKTAAKVAQTEVVEVAKSEEVGTRAVAFRDLAYKSRTLVLEDGRSFAVAKSRIEADDPGLLKWLEASPEFERLPDA